MGKLMSKENIIAKNLLEENTCDICCFILKKIPSEPLCKKDFNPIPEENTCEYWWAWEDEKLS